jgi:NTP pyrophosphatase (non-canonical NTP hydrolase)
MEVKTLEDMELEVYENNVDKGWFDSERSFGDDIALLHTEVSEMFEAFRKGGLADLTRPDRVFFDDDLPKPEGVGSEAADVLIRLLDTCKRAGIELEWEYERKMAYNRTRPHKHGGKRV